MNRILSLSLIVTVVVLVGFEGSVLAQARCDAPQVLLVVDHSSSMGTRAPLADGSLKWDAAVTAIDAITDDFESAVDFGLMTFPSAGECTPGQVDVSVGPGNAAEIEAAMPALPPYSGNWTPMASSLDAALAHSPLNDSSRRSFVALITDGWQWCDPYDAATRFDPVTATERLTAAGITTFVIGFGDGVDSLALNRMAQAAGTAVVGCDPTSDDPARADNCYMQVDALEELQAALEEIASVITEEVCDGLDNDCDGETDEDPVDGFTYYRDADGDGFGTPDEFVTACEPPADFADGAADCDDTSADINPRAHEICDGLDNNCDGLIDPDCLCTNGEERSCGIEQGECNFGEQSCEDGRWSDCRGADLPADEVCDGLDNDCDGDVDEFADCGADFQCIEGACVADDPCADVICAEGFVCVGGDCVEVTPPAEDGPPAEVGSANDGCACSATTSTPTGALSFWLVALVALGLRRRAL